MKKVLLCAALGCTILINIYLIFYWQPQSQGSIREETSKEVVTYSKSIYKVEKEKLMEQLSSKDKKDLEIILKKLSTYDMGRIKEYYEGDNEEKGVIDIFKLLKKRLTSQDYDRVEEISRSLLDLDRIKNRIKNN